MVSKRPLSSTRADLRLFVESDASDGFFNALKREQNVLLTGAPGAGKTSALRITELELRESGRRAVYCSLRPAGDPASAVTLIEGALAQAGWRTTSPTATEDDDPVALVSRLRRLVPAETGGRVIILLDDLTADVGTILFGRLRDELWQLELTWGVAVDDRQAGPLRTPPADAFFDRRVELPALDPARGLAMLRKRDLALAEPALRDLAGHGAVTPRELLTSAAAALDGQDPAARMNERTARLDQAFVTAGRPAVDLLEALEDSGPASASDPALLNRLGWSRPRVATMLRRLEDAGIVEAFEQHDGTPGRPRKLYAVSSS